MKNFAFEALVLCSFLAITISCRKECKEFYLGKISLTNSQNETYDCYQISDMYGNSTYLGMIKPGATVIFETFDGEKVFSLKQKTGVVSVPNVIRIETEIIQCETISQDF
jgi:hypothetical protein